MDQTFFGYNSKDRLKLHNQLFEIVWAGNGKWSFETIYNMPLPMRKFWINKLNEKIAEQRSYKSTQNSNISKTSKMPTTKKSS